MCNSLKKFLAPIFILVIYCDLAFPLPLTGTTLRLVPKGSGDQVLPVGPKIIQVIKKGSALQASWFSLTREAVPEQLYPTYKVKTARGVVEVDGLSGKDKFFHPHLWGVGFVRLSGSLPLWMDPACLGLKGREKMNFEPGFLSLDHVALKASPHEVFQKVLYFQNEYQYYIKNGEINPNASLKRADERELKSFLKEYFQVSLLAKTKVKLVVNKKVQELAARMIGNRYYHLIVLDDVLNPLVVAFRVTPDRAPRVLKKSFASLNRHFEFQVTQVSY